MHNERHVRDSLERRRGELLQRRQRVALDLARANEPLSADSSDQAIQMENDQVLEAIGHAAVEEIRALEAALLRLDRKSRSEEHTSELQSPI